jgi:hypothetical protein
VKECHDVEPSDADADAEHFFANTVPRCHQIVEGGIHEPEKVLEWKFVRLNALAEHSNMHALEGAQFLLSPTRLP